MLSVFAILWREFGHLNVTCRAPSFKDYMPNESKNNLSPTSVSIIFNISCNGFYLFLFNRRVSRGITFNHRKKLLLGLLAVMFSRFSFVDVSLSIIVQFGKDTLAMELFLATGNDVILGLQWRCEGL